MSRSSSVDENVPCAVVVIGSTQLASTPILRTVVGQDQNASRGYWARATVFGAIELFVSSLLLRSLVHQGYLILNTRQLPHPDGLARQALGLWAPSDNP